jgi:hypothetical protein
LEAHPKIEDPHSVANEGCGKNPYVDGTESQQAEIAGYHIGQEICLGSDAHLLGINYTQKIIFIQVFWGAGRTTDVTKAPEYGVVVPTNGSPLTAPPLSSPGASGHYCPTFLV